MATIEQVANDFVEFYYNMFDTNRKELVSLYSEDSMLTFEGAQIKGAPDIVEKLVHLPFEQIRHEKTSLDVQPCPGGGALVFVNGHLITEGQEHPLAFAQVFTLMPIEGEPGRFFVLNDLFRLCYG
eukprot:TRINITY_DN18495_c0_g1_i1.p2 TRINITY_DN18495_c0_g1~~TRINITY_DN18495_c0_g1_i1.p2  ORF type:complete len:145 (+),score=37.08 TRINITY_DN18495_c0_g1_i1:60-437(+)